MADAPENERLARAPVQEMALGVVFHPLEKLAAPFLGIFWLPIEKTYPRFQSRPTIPAQTETFVDPFSQKQQIPVVVNFQHVSSTGATFGDIPQRYIFSDDTGSRVVQIQRDLLTRSWVKKSAVAEYPGYEQSLRADFEKEWARLSAFAQQHALGAVRARQCEATYINMIPRGEGWQTFADLPRLIAPWSGTTELEMPSPDLFQLQVSYPSPDQSGRVVLSLGPAKRAWDDADAISLTISSRVLVNSEDPAAVVKCLDLAHEGARKAFHAFVSRHAFDLWRGD